MLRSFISAAASSVVQFLQISTVCSNVMVVSANDQAAEYVIRNEILGS